MAAEERILRLENTMATLAELSADHGRRRARIEEAFVTLAELTRSRRKEWTICERRRPRLPTRSPLWPTRRSTRIGGWMR